MYYTFDKVAHQDLTVSLRDPAGSLASSELGGLPGVVEVEPQLSVVCDLSNGPRKKRLAVTGLPHGNRLYTPLDSDGRPIVVPDEGLVLTRKVAQILDAWPGDSVRLRPLIGRRQEVQAAVVGIVDSFLGLSAYMDMGYLSRLLGEDCSANMLLALRHAQGLEHGRKADEATATAQKPLLDELKERPKVTGITERTRALRQMNETFGKTMGTIMAIEILFAGLIAFGSVVNAALVSLSEREREVGTLRVLGFMPGQVARIFAGESFLINGLGILLGLGGGIAYTHFITSLYDTELYRFPVVICPSHFINTVVMMIVFIGAAQVIVSILIRHLPWLEVLKVKE
jgi:putative ABC transport system permease protein